MRFSIENSELKMTLITLPDKAVRMALMAPARMARSPAVYLRKNGTGKRSRRSHTAA